MLLQCSREVSGEGREGFSRRAGKGGRGDFGWSSKCAGGGERATDRSYCQRYGPESMRGEAFVSVAEIRWVRCSLVE